MSEKVQAILIPDAGSLLDHVCTLAMPNEKLVTISPFSILRIFPDGSGIFYKALPTGIKFLPLERSDLEALKFVHLPVRQFTPGPEDQKDVHTEHCCVIHGCKYGADDCPVGGINPPTKTQSHACESCYMDATE